MPEAYATVQELRQDMNYGDDTDRDGTLDRILIAVSERINLEMGHPDGFIADQVASARVYPGSGKPWQYIDECVEITLVAVKDSASDDDYDAWTASDWIAFRGNPARPNFNALPYTAIMVDPTGDETLFTSGRWVSRGGFPPSSEEVRGAPTVQVTAKWGFAETCPAVVKMATVAQAARLFKRMEGAMNDAVGTAEQGIMFYSKPLDPDVYGLLYQAKLKRRAGRGGYARA